MCVDFTNLNKACPKDSYPLPNINKLTNNASRFRILSFKNTFTGYNQLKMHMNDEDKITFIANEKGVLLQGNAIRTKKHIGHVPKDDEQSFHYADRKKYKSLCG